jgi:hypothetical protein
MLEANKSKSLNSAAPIPSVTFLQEENFTEDETARALGRAKITLAIWRSQRRGPPYIKVSRRILYRKTSLREWVAAQEIIAPRTFPHGTHATA